MSGRILQNREGGKCLREIIVDRGNGAKAFVLFELTKGNIAEIKDRYILEQLRSAIDSPWSTALPDGIRSALTRSVSEEMEDRFLLENMDKDTDRSVRNAIRSAVITVTTGYGLSCRSKNEDGYERLKSDSHIHLIFLAGARKEHGLMFVARLVVPCRIY